MSHHYSGPNLMFPRGDAADVFVTVITNGKLTGDGIGPHGDLLAEFPYVGLPTKSGMWNPAWDITSANWGRSSDGRDR
jgi:hypothetical protein